MSTYSDNRGYWVKMSLHSVKLVQVMMSGSVFLSKNVLVGTNKYTILSMSVIN